MEKADAGKIMQVALDSNAAKAIAEDNIDRPTTEINEANNAIISQILMKTIMTNFRGFEAFSLGRSLLEPRKLLSRENAMQKLPFRRNGNRRKA
jgi:hypothetical protein